jgi:prolyl-tRNA synthetase
MQRWSKLFIPTLREAPADAEVASHKFLVRAGYIRQLGAGIYSYLFLGQRSINKIIGIVREEMDKIGQEFFLPGILPREPWDQSGRWTGMGDNMFRLKDRKGADLCLGMTHEEIMTTLARNELRSYKQLPQIWYQIQTKFRDEPRPKSGLLRVRQFTMKDSYSFDIDDTGLEASYQTHRVAYQRTFERLGLPYVIVSAMSGAMGGSASEEFLAPMAVGEDTYVRCSSCDYAANTEAVQVAPPMTIAFEGLPAAQVVDTPNTPTIQTLVDLFNQRDDLRRAEGTWTAADTLKNLVVKLKYPDGTITPLAIGVPGDREVDMKRLEAQVSPAEIEPFSEDDFAKNPHLAKGYIGPGTLGENKPAGIRFVVDPRIVDGTAWITGADRPGQHVMHLVAGRDFQADGTIEAAEVHAGDPCPRCGSALEIARGIEIGHIFQLGRVYAEALGLTVLDEHGTTRTVTMGSYGIGVSRAMAAIAELNCDDKGLIWPREVAPADVHIVATGKATDPQLPAAELLAAECEAAGLRVLFDDRVGVSPGVKFNDAELLGVPTIVVVGRGLVDGVVEVKDRRTGDRRDASLAEVVAVLNG